MPPRKKAGPAPAARPELLALLKACKAEPDDDAPRLVLADWLEEHGGEADRARAAFIRLQLRQEREGGNFHLYQLTRQADALREKHQAEWLGPLWEWGGKGEYALHAAWDFRRGLAVLKIEAARFATAEAERRAVGEPWAWVAGVELKHGQFEGEKGRKLLDCPLLSGLSSLDLSWTRLGEENLDRLLALPGLARLRDLKLYDTRPNAGSAAIVARHLGRLKLSRLEVGHNALTESDLRPLARSRHAGGLRTLNLRGNSLDSKGAVVLADSPHLSGLRELVLSSNPIGPGGAAVLLGSAHLVNLERLDLAANHFGDGGARLLAEAAREPRLKYLDLLETDVKADGVAALADSAGMARLEQLELMSCAVGDTGARALAASPHLGRLKDLGLANCGVGPDGAAALVGSAALGGLRRLDLRSNRQIGEEGARRIAASPGLARLTELSLSSCGLTDAGAMALADSPHLPDGVTLVLDGNAVKEATKKALRAKLGERLWSV